MIGLRSKRTFIYHSPADRLAFERRLREAYPEIRFVCIPPWTLVHEPRVIRLNSWSENRYYGAELFAWIEPPNWRPQWSLHPTHTYTLGLWCNNVPERSVSTGFDPQIEEYFAFRPLRGGSGAKGYERFEVLSVDCYSCGYHKDSVEGRRFAERVMRLLRKGATNLAYEVAPDTGLPSTPERPNYHWIGNDAKAWVQAAPNRFCHPYIRPAGDIGSYRWELPVEPDVIFLRPSPECTERWLYLRLQLLKRDWIFLRDPYSDPEISGTGSD